MTMDKTYCQHYDSWKSVKMTFDENYIDELSVNEVSVNKMTLYEKNV